MAKLVRATASHPAATLDADTVNRALENLALEDRLSALPPLSLERSRLAGRTLMIDTPPAAKPMLVQLGVESGTRAGEYEWAELQSNADGTTALKPGGKIGNLTDHPAYEINATAGLAGKNAMLYPGKGDYYWFQHIRDQAGCTRTCLTLLNARYYVEGKPLQDYNLAPSQLGVPTESFVADKIEVYDPNDVLIYSAERNDGTNRPRNQACFEGTLPAGTYKVRVTKNDCVQDRFVTIDGSATVDPNDPSQTCRYYVWCACAHVQVLFFGCDKLRFRLGTMHVTGLDPFDAPVLGSRVAVGGGAVENNAGFVTYAPVPVRLPWEPGTLPAQGDVIAWNFDIPYRGYAEPGGSLTVEYDADLDLSGYDPEVEGNCRAECGMSVLVNIGIDPGFLCGCAPRPFPTTLHYTDDAGMTGTLTALDPDQSTGLSERTWQGGVTGSCPQTCLPDGTVGPGSITCRVTLSCTIGQLQYDGTYRVTWNISKESGKCLGPDLKLHAVSFGTTAEGLAVLGSATTFYTVDDLPLSLEAILYYNPNDHSQGVACLSATASVTE